MRTMRWLIRLLIAAMFVGVLASLRDPVRVQTGAWDVSLPFGLFFFFLFAFVCLFILIDRLLQQGAVYARWRRHRKTHKARSIVLKGLGQLAVRDVVGASESDIRADALWFGEQHDPFRLLFKGRLAEAMGDQTKALSFYQELARQKDARLFALRAQLSVAQKTHDQKLLRRLSGEVLQLAPDDLSLYDIRIEALCAEKQWNKAHDLLKKLEKTQKVAFDTIAGIRHDLYLEQSADFVRASKPMQARMAARHAHSIKPSALSIAAEVDGYLAQGSEKAARQVLQKNWKQHADHTLLPYWEKVTPVGSRFKAYQVMLKANPTSAVTHTALVHAAVEEAKSMEAHAHLEALQKTEGSAYDYAYARAVVAEKIDHDAATARDWYNRAEVLRPTRSVVVSTKPLRTRLLAPDTFA